jgi:hypothetical protein
MKNFCLISFSVLTATLLVFAFGTERAQSRPQYAKAFAAKYAKADSTNAEEKAFAAAVTSAKCGVCHEGESKKNRNAFGKQVAEIIKPKDAPADWKGEKDPKKIEEAFDKAIAAHIDAKDPKSPTFGDLIKAGKLPGGEPKADEKK